MIIKVNLSVSISALPKCYLLLKAWSSVHTFNGQNFQLMSCWPHPARSFSLSWDGWVWSGWGMRISTSESEVKVLNQKWVVCPLRFSGEVLHGVEEFRALRVVLKGERRCQCWALPSRQDETLSRRFLGRRSRRGQPRTRWRDYVPQLAWEFSESSWKSWRICSEGSLRLDCFLCDPAPEKQMNTNENLNYWL